MEIQVLPDDLNISNKIGVQIFNYNIQNQIVKNKITLSSNVFSFLLNGNKELISPGNITKIDNQQFLMIRSGNCLMSENLSPNNFYQSMLMFFTATDLQNFVSKHNLVFAKKSNTQPYFIFDYDDYIRQFVISLQKLQKLSTKIQNQLLINKLEEILLYLIEKKSPEFLANFLDDIDNHFKKTIHNNRYNLLSIAELSFLCNMSQSTFKRHFEQTYQNSPSKWFAEQRLDFATQLLQQNNNRPSDIFFTVGFESLSSFTKAFKEKFQVTPKQFQINKRLKTQI